MSELSIAHLAEHDTDRELHVFAHRLRTLHEFANATVTSESGRVERALRFALEELDLEQGYLGAVDDRDGDLVMRTVVAAGPQPSYGPGKRYPLARTLIGRVVESQTVLAAPDVARARSEQGIAYNDEWKSFIATAIRFGDRRYGAIGFKSRTVRRRPFSRFDIEFVEITGAVIAAAVERSLRYERLDALAFYDALTGLANRVLLRDRLEHCIMAANRTASGFAVFFADLDGFKNVNDAMGHAAGDETLQCVARRLGGAAREADTVARLGGDEFVIVAPQIDTARDARELAKRFAQAIRQPVTVDGRHFSLGACIGISMFPEHGTTADELLARADAAMFEAKTSGKDGICFASPSAADGTGEHGTR